MKTRFLLSLVVCGICVSVITFLMVQQIFIELDYKHGQRVQVNVPPLSLTLRNFVLPVTALTIFVGIAFRRHKSIFARGTEGLLIGPLYLTLLFIIGTIDGFLGFSSSGIKWRGYWTWVPEVTAYTTLVVVLVPLIYVSYRFWVDKICAVEWIPSEDPES